MNNDVNMWIALNKEGKEIIIDNAENGINYFCPICNSIVRARALESKYITKHFYHLNKSNCNGESLLHKYWKDNLINIGESINLPTIGKIECIDKRVECTINTSNGVYRPDLTIKTNNNKYKYIIFEILNTNKKNVKEYKNIWNSLNNCVVFELDVKDLKRDKSNLIYKLKILHNKEIDNFILRSKNKINKLRYILYNNNCYNYERNKVYPSLMKLKELFDNNLEKLTWNKLDKINKELNSRRWSKEVYRDIICPLLKISDEIELYIN